MLAYAPPAPPTPPAARWIPWAAYPLFFASGAAGLIYEVVWTRLLLNTFGAGLYSVCAVLSAFMGGLALGSWLLGRWSDRVTRPLLAYGLLEAAIGACGLVMPALLRAVSVVDGWAYRLWPADTFGPLTLLRFVLAGAVMLVPTTCMGATLPLMARALVQGPEHLGRHVSGLYAINTWGAVAGTFAAGFILIGTFGLMAAERIAAALNLGVATVVMVLTPWWGMRQPGTGPVPEPGRAASPDAPAVPAPLRWIMLTAFVSGAAALAAQVLWTRSLVFHFEYLKNTTYAFSAMLTVYLAGLALGSALIAPVLDRQRDPLRLYGILLTLIGMTVIFSVTVLHRGAMLSAGDPLIGPAGRLDWPLAVANVMLASLSVVGLPTLLMGMAFPTAARLVARAARVGGDVGRLYAVNTLGAIVGSLGAGFVMIPLGGLSRSLLWAGAANAVLGFFTLRLAPEGRTSAKLFGVLALAMLALTMFRLPQHGALQPVGEMEQLLFYKEGPLATVAVVEGMLGYRTLFVDGVGVAGTDRIIQTDQKSLAHLPMMLLPDAKTALTVGFGSGGASYSFLLHDRLERVDCVEICRTVPEAAPFLEAANHGFYRRPDPRYRLLFDDARAWLTHTDARYDVIATDCTDLRYKSNANLYDLEYFRACRARLTPQGIVVVWMPLGGLAPDVFRTALRTFYTVFPQMAVFYMANEPTHYILLVGWQDRIALDYRAFARTLEEADVRADLRELYLDDPVKLLSYFITGGEAIGRLVGPGPLNTENNPLIEFLSPKYGYGEMSVLDNLDALMAVRVSPRRYLDPASMPTDALARLERYERALPYVIAGHGDYRRLRLEEAARSYLQAAALTPEDLGLTRNLLTFPDVQRRAQALPRDPLSQMMLARVLMVQPDKREAALAQLRATERLLDELAQRGEDPAADRRLATVRQWLRELEPSPTPDSSEGAR